MKPKFKRHLRYLLLILAVHTASAQELPTAPPTERAKTHVELGSLYFQYGKYAIALEEVEKALSIDKDYPPAYAMRGLIYSTLRQPKKADVDFRTALEKAPNNPEINNNYGWFLCQTNLAARAFPYFERAYNNPLYETPGLAYANAGDCAAKQGNYQQAEEFLLQGIRVDKQGGGTAKFYLAKLYFVLNRFEEARTRLKEAFSVVNPATPEMLLLAFRVEKALNNPNGAAVFIERLKSDYPESNEYKDFVEEQH